MADIKELPSEEFIFIPPMNEKATDPEVYLDRKISSKVLIEKYTQNSNDLTPEGEAEFNYDTGGNIEYDNSRSVAKEEPLILFNNYLLKGENLEYFHLKSKDFFPELEIMIYDPTRTIFVGNRPGYANKVTVCMIPKLDGKYRGIKLDFYVEDYTKFDDDKILCKCKYNDMALEKRYTKIIRNKKFITPTPDGETWIGSFDMLKSIAMETGFGFRATWDCKLLYNNDRRRHFMQRENYLEFIPRQFEFGGSNDGEIYDVFLDILGFFNMINLPFVVSGAGLGSEKEQWDYHHYSVWEESGTHREDTNTADKSFMQVYRRITNMHQQGGEINLTFKTENFKTVINNYELTTNPNEGTLRTNYYLYPYKGIEECQGPLNFDMQIIENSLEGQSFQDEYEFTNHVFLGFEMHDKNDDERLDVPTLEQKQIVDKYKKKLHKEEYVVELDHTNFGLERGKIVFLDYFEFNPNMKRRLLYNYININQKNNVKSAGEFALEDFDDIINSDKFGVPDTSFCGPYYITGVDYFYEKGSKDIKQTLTLVRFFKMNTNNKVNLEKIYTQTVY